MQLDTWLSADERDFEREARVLAERLSERGVRFASVRTFEYAGQPARSAIFDIGESEFALVPAGTYAIGFDVAGYEPDADVKSSYGAVVRGFHYPRALTTYLERVLAPPSRI